MFSEYFILVVRKKYWIISMVQTLCIIVHKSVESISKTDPWCVPIMTDDSVYIGCFFYLDVFPKYTANL